MIPQNILEKTELIVSYGIMQGGGTNSMGHAYLLFSYYCPEKKRIIVDDAVGLYSTPLPAQNTWRRKISAVSFFDNGHLLQEKFRYLIPNGTSEPMHHYHKSWKISSTQYLALINQINKDRGIDQPLIARNFAQEQFDLAQMKQLPSEHKKNLIYSIKSKESEEHLNTGGPKFDIIKHSCKTDALKRLAAIGIDTKGIHNRLIDLPIYSGKISEQILDFDHELKMLIWKTPLELSPATTYDQESPEMKAQILAQRQYQLLITNLKEMIALFDLKIHDLKNQNTEKPTKQILVTQQIALSKLLDKITSEGLDPKHICHNNIELYFNEYQDLVAKAKEKLIQIETRDNRLKEFIQKVKDIFIDLCTTLGKIFSKPNIVTYSEAYVIQKAEDNLNSLKPKLKASA
jgi:hypothetical protein